MVCRFVGSPPTPWSGVGWGTWLGFKLLFYQLTLTMQMRRCRVSTKPIYKTTFGCCSGQLQLTVTCNDDLLCHLSASGCKKSKITQTCFTNAVKSPFGFEVFCIPSESYFFYQHSASIQSCSNILHLNKFAEVALQFKYVLQNQLAV